MASYNVLFANSVRKDFRKIPKKDGDRILREIHGLSNEPFPLNSKKLTGEELYRIRIGVYRVLYEVINDQLIVTVVKVGHGKDVYRK